MKERLLKLRNNLGHTQAEMASKLKVGRATYACWENGSRDIKDRYISAICREFNVNEEWLRTGKGEMFKKDDFFYDLGYYAEKATDLDKAIIIEWMKLSEEKKATIYEFWKKIIQKIQKTGE